ncbi:hypothetical protein FBQ82_14595 [Anaerolineae bacterium CFX7]|nr:hypothetical protein [Anaerolineae bacterium CFX7]RIK30061.1 MAG: hypothetical protein DCC52_06750 [Chloroflexota bacterium]
MSDAKIGNQFFEIPFCFIIRRVDNSFLIFIVAPLCLYLALVLYAVKDIESSDAPSTQTAAPTIDAAPAPDVPTDAQAVSTESALENASAAAAETVSARETKTAEPAHAENLDVRESESVELSRAENLDVRESESVEPTHAENLDVRESESVEPARAKSISETSVTATSAFLAENANAIVSENVSAPTNELSVAPLENPPENALASESAAPNGPPLEPQTASAAAPIITEPRADESAENSDALEDDEADALPDGPLQLPEKGSPKFVFDYRGRLWVEKKNRGFFKALRRPQLPPDEPDPR